MSEYVRVAAAGDFGQLLPDALLKRRALHVERQVQPEGGLLDERDDLRDEFFERFVAADQLRLREAILKPLHQRIRIIAQRDRADARLRRRDQDRAERAFADGEADGRARAAARKVAGFMPSIFVDVA